MKKVFYFFTLSLLLGFMSCSNEDDIFVNEQGNGDIPKSLKSSVSDPAVNSVTTLNLTADLLDGGITTTGGKYWADTYMPNTNVVSDIFTFSHSSMYDMYSYWDGFTVSNVNDTINYGSGHGKGGSDGWVPHQWGCMPGSGFNTSGNIPPGTPGTSGDPFIVAYWSSYMDPKNPQGKTFSESTYSNWIKIGNIGQYQVQGLKISMHPWPYWGCVFGDGFARPFDGNQNDSFDLLIFGVKADGTITNPITHNLAKRPRGGALTMSDKWVDVNTALLRNLGSDIQYLLFQMTSTDGSEQWGINTAAYFCLDKLKVQRKN